MDEIFPSSAGRDPEEQSLLLRLLAETNKPFDQQAFEAAAQHFQKGVENPLPTCHKHGLKMVTDTASVLAATILFCVLAITILIVATMVATGNLSWISGLILILAFILIIFLSLRSMVWYLKSHLTKSTRDLSQDLSLYVDRQFKNTPDKLKESLLKYLDHVK